MYYSEKYFISTHNRYVDIIYQLYFLLLKKIHKMPFRQFSKNIKKKNLNTNILQKRDLL